MSKEKDEQDNQDAIRYLENLLNEKKYTLLIRNLAVKADHKNKTVLLYPRIEAELAGDVKPLAPPGSAS